VGEVAAPSGSSSGAFPTGTWQLVSGTVDGQPLQIDSDHPITLTKESARGDQLMMSGLAGCNDYGFIVTIVADNTYVPNEFNTTAKGCPADQAALAGAFESALHRTTGWDERDGQLVLTGDGVSLVFAA